MGKISFYSNTPQLRFPHFNDEWYLKRIDEVTVRIADKVNVEKKMEYQQIGIRSHCKGLFHKQFVKGEILGNKRVFWVKDGVFIVNIVFAWEQAVALTTSKEVGMVASHRFPMYKPINDELDIEFLWRIFLTKKGKHLLGMASPGGAGRNKTLGQKSFNELKVKIPSLPEQQKIAAFLSAVDKKIQLLTSKKELLEQYKKGVMQKIFSRKIRFKDENGDDYPDWKEKRLGEILTFLSTNSLSRKDLNYETGEIKNIHYGDIHTTYKMGFDVEKERIPFINPEIDDIKIQEEMFCQVGDVIIADASEDYTDIGKTIEVWNIANQKVVAGLHTFLGRDMTHQTSNGFKGYLLQNFLIRKQFQQVAQGISVLGISKKNIEKIKFKLPCIDEQLNIVILFKSIDNKIEATETEVALTKKFKKGLLQQMFV